MTPFDYVVVGAGPAGCVLANRLSADPATTVLLVEAGDEDTSPLIAVPRGFAELLGDPATAWHYPVRPFGPAQQTEHWVRSGRSSTRSTAGRVPPSTSPTDAEARRRDVLGAPSGPQGRPARYAAHAPGTNVFRRVSHLAPARLRAQGPAGSDDVDAVRGGDLGQPRRAGMSSPSPAAATTNCSNAPAPPGGDRRRQDAWPETVGHPSIAWRCPARYSR
jgi:hypothetical protein